MLHKHLKNILKSKMNKDSTLIDNSSLKVVILACLIIVFSVSLMGSISYTIAKTAVIKKLKDKDLMYIAQSITAKIDGRINRAKETSLILAGNPNIRKWVEGSEKDEAEGSDVKQIIADTAHKYDYDNSFIVSAVTGHYWDENGRLIDTVSKDDPDDSWFFSTIASKQPVSINIDYNDQRKNTFVFIDALVGDVEKPVAVTGIGLNLKDISQEFEGYKFGDKSNMWLVDSKGDIYISEDAEHTKHNISDYLPAEISKRIISDTSDKSSKAGVLEYKNLHGEMYDLIYQPIPSAGWKLVLQIPRVESLVAVSSMKINTIAASIITIVLVVFIFYMVSKKIADPYKRAVLLSQELEKKVNERTQELSEKNIKIMDSIEYAKMIQESILPTNEDLKEALKDYFVIWKPKDTVGGDFYWLKRFNKSFLFVVGDCTGHGVPGALMTMAVNAVLDHVVDEICHDNPALILMELNRLLTQTLCQGKTAKTIGDGLDAGIVYVSEGGVMQFAGAKTSLYIKKADGIEVIKGDNKSIGSRKAAKDYGFSNFKIMANRDCAFYITTDGYIDQNGGEKDLSFGRGRFKDIIDRSSGQPMNKQKEIFEEELHKYMGNEPQRDDITVAGFKFC